ncbi:hypothetical protein OK016_07795 [Vibrio chagasii]|nr:hypothetical protein [Vibrio chagasii]
MWWLRQESDASTRTNEYVQQLKEMREANRAEMKANTRATSQTKWRK